MAQVGTRQAGLHSDVHGFTESSLNVALQVIIYGISGVLIPTGFVDFQDTLDHYLEVILRPGGAELPASFIVEAVNAGELATVAAAFDDVVDQGYTQQLIALLKQVIACSCAAWPLWLV